MKASNITIVDLDEERRLDQPELEKVRGGRIKLQSEYVDDIVEDIKNGGNTWADHRGQMTKLW